MPTNVIAAFFETAKRLGDGPCLHFKREGKWQRMSWREVADSVRGTAAWLIRQGVGRRGRVVICAATSPEWTIADSAILAAGAVTVPIYPSLTAERIALILKDADAMLAFVGNDVRGRFEEAAALAGGGIGIFPIEAVGGERHGGVGEVDGFVDAIAPDDVATIVYTSGTTGQEKGAILTHGNVFAEVEAARRAIRFAPHEVGLVCLPLAHVLGRLMQFYQLVQGCQAAYAQSMATLAEDYLEARPHFTCGVPRMLEKIKEAVEARVASLSWPARRAFGWACGVGGARSQLLQKHRPIPLSLRAGALLADRLAFSKLKGRLGGRMRAFICGGAPLSEEVARFFHAAGLLVLEGYGLTETFAAATVNREDDYHFGTVGKPLPGVEMKLAPDGEVLFRGPTVFKGYRNLPRESCEAFDEEGWFKTGDIGEYSRDGFLRIVGRKKDIIVTAGGKNIAPQMIEAMMSSSPFISHFVVFGDARKYLVALITLNREAVARHLMGQGRPLAEGEALSRNPSVKRLIERHVEGQNSKLAPFETIKRFAILDEDFSIASGELTPTLKVRRAFTGQKYRDVIEGMYR